MKAEINSQNKAKFFAQYWGQKIVKDKASQILFISPNINMEHDSWFLELKPLSSISDEDAEEIGKLYGGFYQTSEDLQDYKDHVYLALIEDDEEAYNMWDHIGFQDMSHVTDYLRSRGYALPWMGLSVEEMVDAGWIKLTE